MTAASRKEPQPDGVVSQGHAEMTHSEEEELYKRACAALAGHEAPSQKRGTALLLLATMVLFAGAAAWGIGFDLLGLIWWFLPLVIGVLLLHEAGHYLGMRLFGYRDLRMFFIPFFGAAVSGQKHAAPAWQQGIVLLLGPLPGIALAALLWLAFPSHSLAVLAAYFLLLLNGFNLLPLFPLDGGKLLHVLIGSRHPLSECAFLLFSGVGLAVVGWMYGSWVFAILGVAVLVAAPFQYRKRQQRVAVRRELPELPAKLGELSEVHQRALFRCARLVNPNSVDPSECANGMKTLHEETVTKPARVIPTIGLLSLYVAAVAVTLTFDPFGLMRGITNLRSVPIVGRITGAFEMSENESLSVKNGRTTTEENPRKGFKFIGGTFELDGEQTLVTKDYVVLDATGSEYLPVGLSKEYGKCFHRDYARRVDLHRNLNSPIGFGNGGIVELALSEPKITLLYEVPVGEKRFQLRHHSIVYEFEVRPRPAKPDE